jgi:PAS domain S-box-containing protein
MLFGIFAYYMQLDDTKRNLESFKSAVEDSYNIVVMTNTKKEITYVNDVFEKVTGYSKEEVIGQNPRILKSGTLEEQFYLHMNEVISSGKKWKGRFVNKTKNSELFYEDATITPIFYQGELSGYLAIKADVTQQVKYEKELEYLNHHLEEKIEDEVAKNLDKEKLLMKQSKMASLGEMMDAIAHQWKQPLNIINMQTSFLEMQNVSGTMNTKMVSKTNEAIFNQVKHLTETIDDFRKFFRVDVKKEHIIIEEVIEQVLSLEKSLLVKNKIETDLASSKHDYHLIASEFKHVFINLINNSIDAFNDNSIKNRVLKFAVSKDDRFINISVIDSAGGIPSHVIDNIFTANFTTKAEGKGTGIGLYMSTNIVLKLGGSIEVENTDFEFEGENVSGAKFIIKLPLLD